MSSTVVPVPAVDVQGDARWLSMHHRFVNQVKELEPDVVFIGDSLISNLQVSDVWENWFEPMHSLNLGIGGDTTQLVLWRILNGELEFIKPKVIVLLVGTNNHENTAEEVAEGIMEISRTIRLKQPDAYLVVLELLPRGEKPNKIRDKIYRVNILLRELIKEVCNSQLVSIDRGFVGTNGAIDSRDMFDYLHLSHKGMRVAFEPVYELLLQLLSENSSMPSTPSESDVATES